MTRFPHPSDERSGGRDRRPGDHPTPWPAAAARRLIGGSIPAAGVAIALLVLLGQSLIRPAAVGARDDGPCDEAPVGIADSVYGSVLSGGGTPTTVTLFRLVGVARVQVGTTTTDTNDDYSVSVPASGCYETAAGGQSSDRFEIELSGSPAAYGPVDIP